MTRKRSMWLFGLLVAPVAVYGALAAVKGRKEALATLFGAVDREPVNFGALVLKPTPNQYLVCPEGVCTAAANAMPPVFDVAVEKLEQTWLDLMKDEPNVSQVGKGPEPRQYDFEALTPLVHFPDTVTVRFLPLDGERSTLAVYSRSHYGKTDFGANEKRIKRWLAALQARLAR